MTRFKPAFIALASGLILQSIAFAAPSNGKKAPTPRDVEVDAVKEAYWNRSADGDIEVVQNRMYSKKHRLTLLLSPHPLQIGRAHV